MICSDCQHVIPNPVRYTRSRHACVWGRNGGNITVRFVCGHCLADPRYRNVIEDDLLVALAGVAETKVSPEISDG